ncbi:MAG: hypothetical protein ACRDT0_13585 [Pseudonocardiaceae bacterium]
MSVPEQRIAEALRAQAASLPGPPPRPALERRPSRRWALLLGALLLGLLAGALAGAISVL